MICVYHLKLISVVIYNLRVPPLILGLIPRASLFDTRMNKLSVLRSFISLEESQYIAKALSFHLFYILPSICSTRPDRNLGLHLQRPEPITSISATLSRKELDAQLTEIEFHWSGLGGMVSLVLRTYALFRLGSRSAVISSLSASVLIWP